MGALWGAGKGDKGFVLAKMLFAFLQVVRPPTIMTPEGLDIHRAYGPLHIFKPNATKSFVDFQRQKNAEMKPAGRLQIWQPLWQ